MPSTSQKIPTSSRKKEMIEEWTAADSTLAQSIFGEHGAIIERVEERTGTSISTRGTKVLFRGEAEAVDHAKRIVQELYALAEAGYNVGPDDVTPLAGKFEEHEVNMNSEEESYNQTNTDEVEHPSQAKVKALFKTGIHLSERTNPILPRTGGQQKYIETINNYSLVFGIGPAGTGKTYLAMAMAVRALQTRSMSKIVLCRPAVEAGEKLGFLPGDLLEKVNPYLRPLYDALYDMMEMDRVGLLIERGIIEIVPLAFMRGRTLNSSFIILDEAQNTTSQQMKMFLTRLGQDSQAVITGDLTQVDLPDRTSSGLEHASRILTGLEGVGMCYFSEKDVVRHRLVQGIIRAYERDDENGKG